MLTHDLANAGTDDTERFFHEPLRGSSPDVFIYTNVECTGIDRRGITRFADLDVYHLNKGVTPAIPEHSLSIEPDGSEALIDKRGECRGIQGIIFDQMS